MQMRQTMVETLEHQNVETSRMADGGQGFRRSAFDVSRVSAVALAAMVMGGCEVDSFFDPSKTGRFEHYPTLMPILDRIDVIEGRSEFWGQTTSVMPDDLLPSDLTYRLAPGDAVTVEIPELIFRGQLFQSVQRIDAIGNFRIPILGDVPAAGLTAQQFQEMIEERLRASVIADPVVNVRVEQGMGFIYTVYGYVSSAGMFQLTRPDLRLVDALSMAGGLAHGAEKVYIIRRVALTEAVTPFSGRGMAPALKPHQPPQQPVDIDTLIRQLDQGKPPSPRPDSPEQPRRNPSPRELRYDGEPMIDIDDLEPARPLAQPDAPARAPRRQAGARTPPSPEPAESETFIYLPDRGWVQVKSEKPAGEEPSPFSGEPSEDRMFVQRIIEVPIRKLKDGDSSYNVVIRPGDTIYVMEPRIGVVFIDGEVFRPGVFSLQPGVKMTLSRLIAAAGGPSPLGIPERVDLVRIIDDNRQAIIRLNLAAIRNGTEPDIVLKPNDHIIMGTSWIAYPLAVFRSGFRATYGFGMVLDRNFGNDVFGPPPVNRFGQ